MRMPWRKISDMEDFLKMMNKSKIEWCDFTWNPVTGCRHGCPYCYAERQANRFCGNAMINKGSGQLRKEADGLWVLEKPFRNEIDKVTPFPVGFEPVLHEYRLIMPAQKKKPAVIFVVSMGDLFGSWVPDEWIQKVFEAAQAAPWHTYLFLTKNPLRYVQLMKDGKLPACENFWYGTTVTRPDQGYFYNSDYHTFLSIEPLLEDFRGKMPLPYMALRPGWVIIGAETGTRKERVQPQAEWIQNLLDVYGAMDVPVFLKNNIAPYWPGTLVQKTPPGIRLG